MYSLLRSLNGVKKHPCITFFLTKAFPKLQVSLLCVPMSYLRLSVEGVIGIRVEDCTPVWTVHVFSKCILSDFMYPIGVDIHLKLVNSTNTIMHKDIHYFFLYFIKYKQYCKMFQIEVPALKQVFILYHILITVFCVVNSHRENWLSSV